MFSRLVRLLSPTGRAAEASVQGLEVLHRAGEKLPISPISKKNCKIFLGVKLSINCKVYSLIQYCVKNTIILVAWSTSTRECTGGSKRRDYSNQGIASNIVQNK